MKEVVMGRHLVLLLLLVLATTAVVSAQSEQPVSEPAGIPLTVFPQHMIAGAWDPAQDSALAPMPEPFLPSALAAADRCQDATELVLAPADGGVTITNGMTEEATDPVLACMWDQPTRNNGFRTVWYTFTPRQSGFANFATNSSAYDTVLAVYSGSCDQLTQLACSDDYEGFFSGVKVPVLAGQTYYVEVADWHFGVSGDAELVLGGLMERETRWRLVYSPGNQAFRSRHAAVAIGDAVYLIAGQTFVAGSPVRTPTVYRYRTSVPLPQDRWEKLANMPGPDGNGYSNTAAGYAANRIYLPSGFVGIDGIYDGTHWAYDIPANTWFKVKPNSWQDGEPAIYGATVSYSGALLPEGYFVIGGLTGQLPLGVEEPTWQPRAEMYYYAAGLDQWVKRQPMNTPRFGHVAARQTISGQDYVCVAGGIGADESGGPILLSSGECQNVGSGQWNYVTGPLNYPRYFAGSAVDTEGNWYIFGGTDQNGNSVFVTERYDAQTNSWIALDVRSDLGITDPSTQQEIRPARSWPRGGFVGQTLWAFGGQRNTSSGDEVLNLVEELFIPTKESYLSIVNSQNIPGEPDDTFENARILPLNVPVQDSFVRRNDQFDVFATYLPSPRALFVRFNQPEPNNRYRVSVYSSSKVWLGSVTNVGTAEASLLLTLQQGSYYTVVERIFPSAGLPPTGQPYQILWQG
ncbi:MAG: Kelch repeat-containing protein [Candidatus Promineifilaceae bacterium]